MKVEAVKEPGRILAFELEQLAPWERPGALDRVERMARASGDLEMARAVRDYRSASREIVSTIQPGRLT